MKDAAPTPTPEAVATPSTVERRRTRSKTASVAAVSTTTDAAASSSDDSESKKTTLFARYNSLLAQYPFFMNGSQAAIIAGSAVLLSQTFIPPKGSSIAIYDLSEVWVMMLINFAFITPILLWFFGWLNRNVNGVVMKLLFDQFVFSPFFTASIIALRFILKGGNPNEIPKMLLLVLPKAQLAGWMFWIPARFFILTFIPKQLALLVNSLFALLWNIIFSILLQ